MRHVTFTVWPNVRSAKQPGEVLCKPWMDWLPDLMQHEQRGPLPNENDPEAVSKLNRTKGGRCFVPGEVDGARNASGVKDIHAAILDLDNVPEDKLLAAFQTLAPYEAVIYTTHKHGFCGATKLRVVMPLTEPVPAARYHAFWIGLNARIGGINDKATKSPQLPYYFPSTWTGSEVAQAWRQEGAWLDPATVIPEGHVIEHPTTDPAATPFGTPRARGLLNTMRKEHDLKNAARALTKGESFAEPGARHETMVRLTGWLAFKSYRNPFTADDIEGLFAPSLSVMMLEDPALDEDPAGAYTDGLTKANQAKKQEQAARADMAREAQRDSAGSSADGEYDDDELARIAAAQQCRVQDLHRRWLIQKGTSFYMLNDRGGYSGPYTKDEAPAAVHQELSRSPVRLIDWTEKGPRDRTLTAIIKESGRVASALVADFTLQNSVFDYETGTMREAVCPIRPIEPRYDEEIEEWLSRMAGPQVDKLFDWMACAPDLSKLLCAIYFCGSKSAGKTLFAHGIAGLWTKGAPTNASEVFASDFNESILSCPLVFADETLPKQHKGMNVTELLRGLLSTSNRKIRRKYQSTSDAAGTLRVILAANNEYLLSAPSMTPDDIAAVSEKVLFVDAPGDAARTYLEGLRRRDQDKLNEWRRRGIAGFCLWLQANRVVEPESRFWVTGDMSTMLRNLLTTTGWNSRVCEFLARYLDSPKTLDNTGMGLVRIAEGKLLVNVRGIIDGWTSYMPEPRFEMETSKISAAVRSISEGRIVRRFKSRQVKYWIIDVENITAWSDRNQVGESSAMRSNLIGAVADADESIREELNKPVARGA